MHSMESWDKTNKCENKGIALKMVGIEDTQNICKISAMCCPPSVFGRIQLSQYIYQYTNLCTICAKPDLNTQISLFVDVAGYQLI